MHHITPDSFCGYPVLAIFVPYPQTIELLGEAQAMDAPPLRPEEDLSDTPTDLYIPALTNTPGKPRGPTILIFTPTSVSILLSQSQQSMGHT